MLVCLKEHTKLKASLYRDRRNTFLISVSPVPRLVAYSGCPNLKAIVHQLSLSSSFQGRFLGSTKDLKRSWTLYSEKNDLLHTHLQDFANNFWGHVGCRLSPAPGGVLITLYNPLQVILQPQLECFQGWGTQPLPVCDIIDRSRPLLYIAQLPSSL